MSWKVESFDRTRHIRDGFDCGEPLLNDWFKTQAGQYERKNLTRVFVAVDVDAYAVRGFYSISSHTVTYDVSSAELTKGVPKIDIPTALIGRLAVDRSSQGQGLGEFMLMDALRRIVNLSNLIGVRAIEVEAINDSAKKFYARYGFTEFKDRPLHLYMMIHLVKALNLPRLP